MLRVENNMSTFVPVSVARARKQLRCHGECRRGRCCSCDPVTFLHRGCWFSQNARALNEERGRFPFQFNCFVWFFAQTIFSLALWGVFRFV
jgi:hypothetical protein